jgi:hypothetical protein
MVALYRKLVTLPYIVANTILLWCLGLTLGLSERGSETLNVMKGIYGANILLIQTRADFIGTLTTTVPVSGERQNQKRDEPASRKELKAPPRVAQVVGRSQSRLGAWRSAGQNGVSLSQLCLSGLVPCSHGLTTQTRDFCYHSSDKQEFL